MIFVRKNDTRGLVKNEWITSYRTFSNNSYFDPRYHNFGDLLVINDDRVQPNNHTPEHEHKDVEVYGYVVEGFCRHHDNLGNDHDVPAGSIQRMSNGSGIKHTEGNSSDKPNRYLQIWIQPNEFNTKPEYDYAEFTREEKLNNFCDVTTKLPVKQDFRLLTGIFNKPYNQELNSNRSYYLYVISGKAIISGCECIEGDGLSYIDEKDLSIEPFEDSEILLFDMLSVNPDHYTLLKRFK